MQQPNQTCACTFSPALTQIQTDLTEALNELQQLKIFCLNKGVHPLEFEEWTEGKKANEQ
jgi:hypothetical protein|tara:strand:+ start:86 stop:265 length:180 start_codon:yes stop_codon:yes gene_type:complete